MLLLLFLFLILSLSPFSCFNFSPNLWSFMLYIWSLTPFPLLIFLCRFRFLGHHSNSLQVKNFLFFVFLLFHRYTPSFSFWWSISIVSWWKRWISFTGCLFFTWGLMILLGGEASGAQSAWSMAELLGPRLYSCCNCRNHVAFHDDIISKAFQVMKLKPKSFVIIIFLNLSAFDHQSIQKGLLIAQNPIRNSGILIL